MSPASVSPLHGRPRAQRRTCAEATPGAALPLGSGAIGYAVDRLCVAVAADDANAAFLAALVASARDVSDDGTDALDLPWPGLDELGWRLVEAFADLWASTGGDLRPLLAAASRLGPHGPRLVVITAAAAGLVLDDPDLDAWVARHPSRLRVGELDVPFLAAYAGREHLPPAVVAMLAGHIAALLTS